MRRNNSELSAGVLLTPFELPGWKKKPQIFNSCVLNGMGELILCCFKSLQVQKQILLGFKLDP